jgi:hypothetical protein
MPAPWFDSTKTACGKALALCKSFKELAQRLSPSQHIRAFKHPFYLKNITVVLQM